MKLLEILKLTLSIVPMAITAIKAVEEAIPGAGAGEAKLAAVRGIIESGYKVATDVTATFEDTWPAIESTVSALVGAFNATGIFKKGD